MALEKYFPFRSVSGDRKYSAEDWAAYFAQFIRDGVFYSSARKLKVAASEGMKVAVQTGAGFVAGRMYILEEEKILALDIADGVLNRIDRIVLCCDYVNRKISIEVKKGRYGEMPTAPELTRDADVYELALADVYIAAGAVAISEANITDQRLNNSLCGIVTGLVDQADTKEIFNQFQAYLQEFKEMSQADFEYWFKNVKAVLDEDATGNLLTKINAKADKTELAAERARIDKILALPEGGTVEEAALNDIAVAADGTVYETPGAAVRAQVTNLKSDLSKVHSEVFTRTNNLANPEEFTLDSYMDGSGSVVAQPIYFYTGKIPVTEGDTLYFTQARFVTCFNDDVVVPCEATYVGKFTVPSGVNAVVLTGWMTAKDAYMVNVGDKLLDYEPYYTSNVDVITQTLAECENAIDNYVVNNVDFISEQIAEFSTPVSTYEKSRFSGNTNGSTTGKLHSITAKFTDGTSGTAKFIIMHNDGEKFVVDGSVEVEVVSGLHTYINGVDFEYNNEVLENSYVGFYSESRQPFYHTDGTSSFAYDGDASTVSSFLASKMAYNISIGMTIVNEINKARYDELNQKIENLSDFADNVAVQNKCVDLEDESVFVDADTIFLKVKLNNLSSKIHLYRNAEETAVLTSRVDFVDFANGKIGFYKPVGNATTDELTVYTEKSVGFAFVAGHEYLIESIKDKGEVATIRVTDAYTFESDELSAINNIASGWGKRGYSIASGDIEILDAKKLSTQPYNAKVLIIGDSYVEGNSITGYKEQRWAYRIKEALEGNVFINGMGGATAGNGVTWLNGYLKNLVRPKYVIAHFGVNDANYDTYVSAMTELIRIIKEDYGAIPILVRVPVTNRDDSIKQQFNEWIEASGEKYFNERVVLTSNYDDTTQNKDLFISDEVHPTVEAHGKVFERIKIDLPELFIN